MFNPIKKPRHIISYIYRNIILPHLLNEKYRDILKKNLAVKNINEGKRCFVLGNGPSIKDVDLDNLKDEHLFVVNEFDRHPKFKNLQHVYHVIPDTGYFIDDKSTYFWERLKNKSDNTQSNTIYFFNIKGKNLIDREKLFPKNPIYYLSSQGIISENFNFNIDIDKTIPWPKNSILSCLMTAVYMGFNEIYLLGCEHSFLAHNLGPNSNKPAGGFDHFYKNKDLEQITKIKDKETREAILAKRYMRTETDFAPYNYELSIVQTLQLFKNYRLFYEKIKKSHPEIKILNATPNSFLDVFPPAKYEDVIHKI